MSQPSDKEVRLAVARRLEARLRQFGIPPEALDDDTDLMESGILDSFAFVEILVGVSEDLELKLDLADVVDAPFSTVSNIAETFLRAASGGDV